MSTTQTGIPVIDCETCHHRHPATRSHCTGCGIASAFIQSSGACWRCESDDIPEIDGQADILDELGVTTP